MKVVVVESPAKAKTINKYLGNDFRVIASYGHIRDLPAKNGSVDPQNGFKAIWQLDEGGERHLNDIIKTLKGADTLYLATDPDREGEAISWHVKEALQERGLLKNLDVKRVVFYEITKRAVQEAIQNPRDLDRELIAAYLTRRSLDYLVGFNLSPILWRKLPGSRSAGRVQSVALRLVAEREAEIEAFKSQEYWSITGTFKGATPKEFDARLTHLAGKKLDKFDINSKQAAENALNQLRGHAYFVQNVEKKQVKRHPAPPFITSTLQQEASRKLGFGARKTMQVAQRLYEGVAVNGEVTGLITYMRTDSVNLAQEAITSIRDFIGTTFGASYVPSAPRAYKSKAKNAQEAHEAIRPTDIRLTPQNLKSSLDKDQLALYELIWKRAVACQMESALLDQVSVDISEASYQHIFRATGSTIAFDGFLKLYEEGRDDDNDEDGKLLPPMNPKDPLETRAIEPEQHFTQPPARFTEATLVKRLEELGIGRPSTYATIMSTLTDRGYVDLEKKRLIPTPLGRLVTSFLAQYFPKYVQYDFTANLEEQLDEISEGKLDWHQFLNDFWQHFSANTKDAETLKIQDVINALNQDLSAYIFPPHEDGSDPRTCAKCRRGTLSLRLGKYGAFVGCSDYPECDFTRKLTTETPMAEGDDPNALAASAITFETRELGPDPASGEMITVRKGPYGFYLQWGDVKGKEKPKRVALPRGQNANTLSLAQALELSALPRTVGTDPESGAVITAALGRFGPYVKRGSTFASLTKDDDVLSVGLERALELLAKQEAKKAAAPAKETKAATPKKTAAKKTTAKATTTRKKKA